MKLLTLLNRSLAASLTVLAVCAAVPQKKRAALSAAVPSEDSPAKAKPRLEITLPREVIPGAIQAKPRLQATSPQEVIPEAIQAKPRLQATSPQEVIPEEASQAIPRLEVSSPQEALANASQEALQEVSQEALSQEAFPQRAAGLSVAAIPSEIHKKNVTCGEWASWIPPRTSPAVVMQVVSEDYVDLEYNFLRLMELNSAFTRQHLFLMCLDDETVPIFASLGIRCVPLGALKLRSEHDLWKTRIRVLSCLVTEGYDVIMSDSDALWLGDPMDSITLPAVSASSIIASRGSFPYGLGELWGTTICMGFILFRATGASMDTFQDVMERIVLRTGDDQIAVNRAALGLGIAWDEGSDMRYENSTGIGKGTIAGLSGGEETGPFEVTLLPHNKFTRECAATPISKETTVAHCHYGKKERRVKEAWMRDANLWSPGFSSP